MNGIKNIVFDLGGVLVDLDITACKAAFEALGMHAVAQIIDPCYPAEMIGQLEAGEISAHQACEKMRQLARTPQVSDEQIGQAYRAFIAGVPIGKLRMLDTLRGRGLKLYVLSNNNPIAMEGIRRLFEQDGKQMEDYFDQMYLSYQMHALKPSSEIFRKMVEHSGMIPEQTLFVDDGQKNVETAREMGFAVYLAEENEDFGPIIDAITEDTLTE